MPTDASVIRAAIWQRFEHEKPRPGPELDEWVDNITHEAGVAKKIVLRVITGGMAAAQSAFNDQVATRAQQLADLMGADLITAFEVLRESYGATKKKVLLDKSGRPKLVDESEGGPGYVPENMIYIEVPDWNVRLSAVRTAVEIYGARAPQVVEINQKTTVLDLTTEDALAQIADVAQRAAALRERLARGLQGTSGSPEGGGAAPGGPGPRRQDLLDDGGYQDQG